MLPPAVPPPAVPAAAGLDGAARQNIVLELARQLEREYLIAAEGAQLATLLRRRAAEKAYERLTSPPALVQRLQQDLQSISSSSHLHVFFSAEPPPVPPPPGGAPPPELVAKLREQELEGGILEKKVLPGNIGYLALWGVPVLEVVRDDIAEAFASLHGTAALILDNRQNKGGDPRTAALYLSYLLAGPSVVYMRVVGRDGAVLQELSTTDLGPLGYGREKPVYVLTSRETYSGGEGLSYHLQAARRAVVIGEQTAGGGRRGKIVSLGHDLYAMIPNAQGRSAFTGRDWEGVGVQPDVLVPASAALAEAQRLAAARLQPGRR